MQLEGRTMTLEREVEQIRKGNPQRFGILRHHFSGVQQALALCERNYPEARQFYNLVNDSETSPRAFGSVLTILAEFDVIQTYNERNNRNRYDITQYQPETLHELGELLKS